MTVRRGKPRGGTREQTIYFRKRQAKAAKHGLCLWCTRPSDGKPLCPRCHTLALRRYRDNRDAGRCTRCEMPARGWACPSCRDKTNASRRSRRAMKHHSLATLIYIAALSPTQAGCEDYSGRCYYCGASSKRGVRVEAWAGDGFGGYARAAMRHDPSSTHVCEACVFVCSRLSPVPGRPAKEGKKLGGNFRNFSHFAELDVASGTVDYGNANKGEMATVVAWLRSVGRLGPWGLAVAVTGQKHVISTTPLNLPGQDACRIAFEEQVVACSRQALLDLVDDCNGLRERCGCSGDAIATGTYHAKDLERGLESIRSFEARNAARRGSGVLELAAFLTTNPSKAKA